MKYNFSTIQQSISYLKGVYWYRYQYTQASLNKIKNFEELYKTKHFLIINKPYDLIVYNFTNDKTVSLFDLLKEKYPMYYDGRVTGGFRVLHRIDATTSGCLCIPLTPYSFKYGYEAFLKNEVKKYYLALVYGHVKREATTDDGYFEINASIGEDSLNRVHLICTKFDQNGNLNKNCIKPKPARTLIKVLEHGTYNQKPCTKLLLKLITGRRHQLRVHLNHIGHPVVGDLNYGINDYDTYRTMLHSYYFSMKIKNKIIKAIAKDPFINDIDNLWKPENVVNKLEIMLK